MTTPTPTPPTSQTYSNTIVGAIVGLVGLAIVAFYVLPEGPAGTIFGGLIVMIVLQLLAVRQQEANGHRITRAEDHIVAAAATVAAIGGQTAANTGAIQDVSAAMTAAPTAVTVVNPPDDPVHTDVVAPPDPAAGPGGGL